MKINQYNTENTQQYKKIEDNKNLRKTQEKTTQKLNEEKKEINASIIKTSSNVNSTKVDEIKQKIANGEYKVDAKSISDKLLKDKNLMKTLLN